MNPAGNPEPDSGNLHEIVFSLGDPNGIGPEITLKALQALLETADFHPVLAGDRSCLHALGREMDVSLPWDRIEVVPAGDSSFTPEWGRVSEEAGKIAFASLTTAADICKERKARLMVTAPVNKQSLRMAGFRFPGQTEFLADCFDAENYCMAFLSNVFHLLLATIHIPLSQVPRSLDREGLYRKCCLFHEALCRLGNTPRIAVSGMNPHASENSLFGREEEEVITPVIERLRSRFGQDSFSGPYPPDTVFNRAASGTFDAVVAMYHDQGLIPLKLLAFDKAVNTTLGLPLARTSPDHGTAFDIAGSFSANPDSMIEAVKWGMRLSCPPSAAGQGYA